MDKLNKDRINEVKDLGQIVKRPGFFKWKEEGIDLRPYSTIGIGGKAACVVRPRSEEEIQIILAYCRGRGIPYSIKGAGSNVVYGDLDALIDLIDLNNFIGGDDIDSNPIIGADQVESKDGIIIAQAGVLLGRRLKPLLRKKQIVAQKEPSVRDPDRLIEQYRGTLAGIVYEHSLSGVEDLADIPGTVGGATVMNAGVYQQWMAKIVEEVILINPQGNRVIIPKQDLSRRLWFTKSGLKFKYRYSILQEEQYQDHIIYAVKLRLNFGDQEKIKQRMFKTFRNRREKHPKSPSIGSVFRLRGYELDKDDGGTEFHADELIQQAKIGGSSIGGIYIPKKYPVFFVNKGHATLNNFIDAMFDVYNWVKENSGIRLQPEVKFLPYSITPNFNGNIKYVNYKK